MYYNTARITVPLHWTKPLGLACVLCGTEV